MLTLHRNRAVGFIDWLGLGNTTVKNIRQIACGRHKLVPSNHVCVSHRFRPEMHNLAESQKDSARLAWAPTSGS